MAAVRQRLYTIIPDGVVDIDSIIGDLRAGAYTRPPFSST
jgi:hypothetical protein